MKDSYYLIVDGHLASADLIKILNPATYLLTRIRVQPEIRGRGLSHTLLAEICKDADREGATIVLQIVPEEEGMTRGGLEALYLRFGFEPFQTSESDAMIREPRDYE